MRLTNVSTRILPALRKFPIAVVALGLHLLTLPVVTQVTNGTDIGELDHSRARTKEIRDARQAIDDFPAETWRNAAYVLVELVPNENGSATVTIAEQDRSKLIGVKKSENLDATTWLVAEPGRTKLEVNYYQIVQSVTCSVPKKLRGKPLTLAIFKVYESQVECFVRERAASP